MLIEELANMLRLYTNEPDQTFEDDALVALWLELAYSDFRSMVCEIDPTIYATTYDVTLSGATLDLTNVLVGAAPTQPRLDTLLDITVMQGAQETIRWRGGTNPDDIIRGNADYVLIGSSLRFPLASSAAVRIYYMPAQNVNSAGVPPGWIGGIVPGSNTYLDDLDRFHDMIPLIAYLQYAVLDAAEHPQQMMLLGRRQQQMKHYLAHRGGPGATEVVDSRWMEP